MKHAFAISLAWVVGAGMSSCWGNLVHHYPFDADASDAVGGADGALVDGASVVGGVLSLDGSGDYVQLGEQIVPVSGSYSVALFALQSTAQGDNAEYISQGFGGGPGFYIGTTPGFGGTIRATDSWQNTGAAIPSIGDWHHIALTVDASGGVSRLYVDGMLSATLGAAIVTASGGTNTRFGQQFSGSEYFAGMLDDIRVYDHALSAVEVGALAGVPEASPLLLLGALSLIGVGARYIPRAKRAEIEAE
jgi:hypothetical protein